MCVNTFRLGTWWSVDSCGKTWGNTSFNSVFIYCNHFGSRPSYRASFVSLFRWMSITCGWLSSITIGMSLCLNHSLVVLSFLVVRHLYRCYFRLPIKLTTLHHRWGCPRNRVITMQRLKCCRYFVPVNSEITVLVGSSPSYNQNRGQSQRSMRKTGCRFSHISWKLYDVAAVSVLLSFNFVHWTTGLTDAINCCSISNEHDNSGGTMRGSMLFSAADWMG